MIKYSVKKPFTVLVAVIIVLVIGVVSLTGMETNLLPEMDMPYMMVITTYPGASPEKVEENVTKPMESTLGTINGVKSVTSTSAENYSMVMLEFEEDTNMDSAMVKVSSGINQIEGQLPDICGTPDVMELSIIPRASELVEITAMEASPFILVFELTFKRKNEARIVTGIAITRGLAFKAKAIAIEPNPTWLNPSPIIE